MNTPESPDDAKHEGTTVLVLSSQPQSLAVVCDGLEAGGVKTVRVSSATDAIRNLRERTIGLLLVDAAIARPGVVELLAKVRDVMPQVGRAVFEISPGGQMDFPDLINRAQPCAFFTGTPSTEKVREVLQSLRSAATAPVSSPTAEPARKPAPPGLAFGAGALLQPMTSPKKTEKPDPKPVFSPAEPRKKEPDRSGPGKPARTGSKWEIDSTAPDMVAEVSRIIGLLLEEPDIQLPVLPQIAREVRKELAREEASFEKIAGIVAHDPSMSAKILAVANSPLYAGVEKIRNLQQAVSRIGMRETRNILQAVTTKNLFAAQDSRLAALMAKLWLHSLACAYSNEIVAKDLRIKESSDFFMMGLLHDIGKLLIIHLIQTGYERKLWTRKIITDELVAGLFLRGHNTLGKRLIEKWGYDKSFQDTVFLHNDDFSKVRSYSEPVVVTFYSNLLTRKMRFSLLPYPDEADPLGAHDLAQALNMTPEAREHIENTLRETLSKVQESYR